MSKETRSPLESGFGRDLADVRIHDDSRAHNLADSLHAQAFSVGQDLFFGEGRYQPRFQSGRRLLAHEIFHRLHEGSGSEVIRRNPSQDILFDDNSNMKTHDEIAKDIIEKLEADPSRTMYVSRVLSLPTTMGLASPWHHEQQIAMAFFENVSKDLVSSLKSSRSGWSILRRLINLLPAGAYGNKAIRKRVGDVFSDIRGFEYDIIKAEDFPEDNKCCMDLVLFNLEVLIGEDRKAEAVQLANENRRTAVASAKAQAAKLPDGDSNKRKMVEVAGRRLNSQNLNAASELGYTRRVGEAPRNPSGTGKTMINHDMFNSDKDDPFVIRGGKHASFFTPNPIKMMLDAIDDAPSGVYMFSASVAKHHSVTVFLQKTSDGPVSLGSGKYSLEWNDQYNDQYNLAAGTILKDDQDFITEVFRSSGRHDPRESRFWWGNETRQEADRDTYMENRSDNSHAIVGRAVDIRYKNVYGLELWHVNSY